MTNPRARCLTRYALFQNTNFTIGFPQFAAQTDAKVMQQFEMRGFSHKPMQVDSPSSARLAHSPGEFLPVCAKGCREQWPSEIKA
jgi:hypothetical protein